VEWRQGSDNEIKDNGKALTDWHMTDVGLHVCVMCLHIVNAILTGPLPGANDSFIVANSYLRNIYQVDITSGATAQLLPIGAANAPMALAYDSTAKLVYWTDVAAHTINRYSLLTNSSTVIYRNLSYTGKDYA